MSIRPAHCLLFALSLLAVPAQAHELWRLAAQVPLLPLPETGNQDVEALVADYWKPHWKGGGEHGFTRSALRAGRFDLNGDGRSELFVMIDQASWEADHGKPFVVAAWGAKGWSPIGWGWGDEDRIFVTGEVLQGWRSVDSGPHWLRWTGKVYHLEEKPKE